MYEIERNRWTAVAAMKKTRYHHSCLTISTPSESKVLVCGGKDVLMYGSSGRTDCEIWTNGQWTDGPTVPSSKGGSRMIKPSFNSQFAAFVVGGREHTNKYYQHGITNKIYGIKKDLTSVKMIGAFQQARYRHVAFKTTCQ